MNIQGGKFLTFLLGGGVYGIPIKKVKEIIGNLEITGTPEKAGGFIPGAVNLRGKPVPIVDLRSKFGMEASGLIQHTCAVIFETTVLGQPDLLGIMVDSVAEVVNIAPNDIEPPPEYEAKIEGEFLGGLGKLKGKVILILDCDRILNEEEIAYIKQEL